MSGFDLGYKVAGEAVTFSVTLPLHWITILLLAGGILGGFVGKVYLTEKVKLLLARFIKPKEMDKLRSELAETQQKLHVREIELSGKAASMKAIVRERNQLRDIVRRLLDRFSVTSDKMLTDAAVRPVDTLKDSLPGPTSHGRRKSPRLN